MSIDNDYAVAYRRNRRRDPNDAIQSLARIAEAAARLMAHMHHDGDTSDPDDDVTHMQANLDFVAKQVSR